MSCAFINLLTLIVEILFFTFEASTYSWKALQWKAKYLTAFLSSNKRIIGIFTIELIRHYEIFNIHTSRRATNRKLKIKKNGL